MKYVLCLNLIPCMVQELIFIQLFQRINKFHISFTFNRKQNPSYQLSLHSCTTNKKNIFFSFSIFLNLFCFVILFVYLFVSINNVPLLVLKIMEHVSYLNLMNLFEIVSFTSWLFCIYIDHQGKFLKINPNLTTIFPFYTPWKHRIRKSFGIFRGYKTRTLAKYGFR